MPDREDIEIVTCPECKGKEYHGMMHWRSGRIYCRKCIYDIWAIETEFRWKPGKDDHIFPLYEDGKDYSKGVANSF